MKDIYCFFYNKNIYNIKIFVTIQAVKGKYHLLSHPSNQIYKFVNKKYLQGTSSKKASLLLSAERVKNVNTHGENMEVQYFTFKCYRVNYISKINKPMGINF